MNGTRTHDIGNLFLAHPFDDYVNEVLHRWYTLDV